MNNNKLTVKDRAKNIWDNHKGLILAAGVGAVIGIGFLIKNSLIEKEEIVTDKVEGFDYSIHWLQGDETGSGVPWTLDLPVGKNSTVEAAIRGALDDLNSGKFKEMDL